MAKSKKEVIEKPIENEEITEEVVQAVAEGIKEEAKEENKEVNDIVDEIIKEASEEYTGDLRGFKSLKEAIDYPNTPEFERLDIGCRTEYQEWLEKITKED